MANWQSILPGVLLLLALVGVQVGMRRLNVWQVRKAWFTGNKAAKEEDWPTAARAFRVCTKKLPMWTAGQTMLGVALAHQGNLDDAAERFHMAASLEPKNPEGYFGLLYFYATHRPNDMERAAAALRDAFVKDPTLREKLMNDARLIRLRNDPALRSLFE